MARATRETAREIAALPEISTRVASSIRETVSCAGDVEQNGTNVASAIEEQAVVTKEIAGHANSMVAAVKAILEETRKTKEPGQDMARAAGPPIGRLTACGAREFSTSIHSTFLQNLWKAIDRSGNSVQDFHRNGRNGCKYTPGPFSLTKNLYWLFCFFPFQASNVRAVSPPVPLRNRHQIARGLRLLAGFSGRRLRKRRATGRWAGASVGVSVGALIFLLGPDSASQPDSESLIPSPDSEIAWQWLWRQAQR